MLRSDLHNFSEAYIVVKGTITVTGTSSRRKKKTFLAFKHNAPIISCISKINNTLTDNAEDLDVVMPIQNLIEYSKNYRKTAGSLWNYYRDELTDDTNNNNIPNKNVINSKSFKYKTSVTGSTLMGKLPLQKVMKLITLPMMQMNLVNKKLKLLFH